MRLVHSDTSALSQTLSVRALTCTRVLVSRTPLGFTFSYSHKICNFFTEFSREKQDPPHTLQKYIFQYLFQYLRPETVFFFSSQDLLAPEKRPWLIFLWMAQWKIIGNLQASYLHIYITSPVYCGDCGLSRSDQALAAELSICMQSTWLSQSVQCSRNFCPPVVR